MWVVREVSQCYDVERGNVVDDYRDELKDLDRDEHSIFVVRFE